MAWVCHSVTDSIVVVSVSMDVSMSGNVRVICAIVHVTCAFDGCSVALAGKPSKNQSGGVAESTVASVSDSVDVEAETCESV